MGFGKDGQDGDRVAIIDMLQRSGCDILEDTSEDWEISLFYTLSKPWIDPEDPGSERSDHRSTYLQRLKQLGIRFGKESHLLPHIFVWIARIRSHELTLKAGKIEFTLQTMLESGADIYARLRGEPPLHFAFSQDPDFSDETRLNV